MFMFLGDVGIYALAYEVFRDSGLLGFEGAGRRILGL